MSVRHMKPLASDMNNFINCHLAISPFPQGNTTSYPNWLRPDPTIPTRTKEPIYQSRHKYQFYSGRLSEITANQDGSGPSNTLLS